MSLVPLAAPAQEPVSLADAKAHLRVDIPDDDALISRLITGARSELERGLGRALITQTWTLWLDAWPPGFTVPLPLAPVQSIEQVRIYASDDSFSILPATGYLLDGQGAPPRLIRRGTYAWPQPTRPGNGIAIDVTAGHGSQPTDVPAALRIALLVLVGHWYENRQLADVSGGGANVLPAMVRDLIDPYRVRRL
jgi:uncharacterized phiE125 gp8 family phage protein